MLGDIWHVVRASFNGRLLLYSSVVTCFTMFGSIPIATFKFPFLFAFIPAASLFLIILSRNLILPNFKLILQSRRGERLPVPNELKELARRMNVPLEEIKIIESDEKNAVATLKGIAFTRRLWSELTHSEIMAVAAHELGHKKGRHGLYRFLVIAGFIALPVVAWSRFTSPILFNEGLTRILFQAMMDLTLLAFMIVMMIPVLWISEFKADEAAARFVGKKNIQSALLKLGNKENLGQSCETHPSIQERVKHIGKMKT